MQAKMGLLILVLVYYCSLQAASQELPECNDIPKILCCTERVIEKCLSGCLDHIMETCPSKLERFETIGSSEMAAGASPPDPSLPLPTPSSSRSHASYSPAPYYPPPPVEVRRAPQSGDYRLLNPDYPVTEVSDKDLTSDCGTETSRPPYSPCLSRKTVDDVFLACCQQHVPSSCHSLCTYEHREQVAAENLIQAVQQDGCDLKHLSKILYCANQNRDNRPCCKHLGMNSDDLGVSDRCLRMCNVAQSGDRVGVVEKDDLVCLSNWNVLMYCARSGLRTIN